MWFQLARWRNCCLFFGQEIVASSLGKSLSVTMGNVGSDLKRGMLKIIWLEPQSGKA